MKNGRKSEMVIPSVTIVKDLSPKILGDDIKNYRNQLDSSWAIAHIKIPEHRWKFPPI